jgi:perosamine synthetase
MDNLIQVYQPELKLYKSSVSDAIESGWVSCHGPYKHKVQQKLKEITGANYILLTCNGTTATHCLFIALKHKYPHIRKIYVPNHVYVAAINSVIFEYDKSMIEVLEIDDKTWNMREDEEYIKSLDENSALLVVHNLGNIVNVPRIHRLRPDLVIIEDNCEGLFGKYEGMYSGCCPDTLCSSVSFFGNKTITSGEGGAVIIPSDDKELAELLTKKISQGMTEEKYVHDMLAYNYRMTNVAAALLYDQLLDVESILSRKHLVFHQYVLGLRSEERISFQLSELTEHSRWMVSIRIKGNPSYKMFNSFMLRRGIDTRPFFYSLSKHEHLKFLKGVDKQKDLSEILSNEIVILPSSPGLADDTNSMKKIVKCILDYCQYLQFYESVTIRPADYKSIKEFVSKINSKHFRYFNYRDIGVCNDHILTIVACLGDEIVGYGHLDPEQGRVWLGICVSEDYQGKGIGKKIMNQLIRYADERELTIHLTVDEDNQIARNLYQKYNFRVIDNSDRVFTMIREVQIVKSISTTSSTPSTVTQSIVSLPVSIGEAIDKWTILEIKKEKIDDEAQLQEVDKEMKALHKLLKDYILRFSNYKNILKQINLKIWEDQDRFRASVDSSEQAKICLKIIQDNDARFRVKKKINSLADSELKEQKSYAKKGCLLLGHLGLGDMFTMIGAIRYLAIYYDRVMVVVKQMYFDNVKMIFDDDPSIEFLVVTEDKDISPAYGASGDILNQYWVKGYKTILCGTHKRPNIDLKFFYRQFYDDVGIDWNDRFIYGHVNRNEDLEESLFQELKSYSDKFIFVHDKLPEDISSRLISEKSDNLIFNVNRNAYESFSNHPWAKVWKEAHKNLPVPYYCKVLEFAEEIHVTDSAFFCLCMYLDLSRVKKCVVYIRKSSTLVYDMTHYIAPHQKWEIRY